eukprot:687066-Prorocentrum_minimum.AAC.1
MHPARHLKGILDQENIREYSIYYDGIGCPFNKTHPYNTVLMPRALFPLRFKTVGAGEVKEVQRELQDVWRGKAKSCCLSQKVARRLLTWFSPWWGFWGEAILAQKTFMLQTLNREGTQLQRLAVQAVDRGQKWSGLAHPVMETRWHAQVGNDHTLLGHIHMALAERGFQVVGGVGLQSPAGGKDVTLAEVAPESMSGDAGREGVGYPLAE